ncbi:MAG: zinc metallopeptidase [Pirellulales bacterium]|nr:zinc metallopeptidase [Pirellulales bacterium]
MFLWFDPLYFVFLAPALLLMAWAQYRVKSTYAAAQQFPVFQSGERAARDILDSAGLHNVRIELAKGRLSDHYDPRQNVLRLSHEVYAGKNAAAVGIAAHEAGHALQDAKGYAPMGIRNMAVPMAQFGSSFGILFIILGAILSAKPLIWVGIIGFAGVAAFQLINLPVEFNASHRAKVQLANLGIVGETEMTQVKKMLSAAALTYVAATLQSILILLYYVYRFAGSRD